MAYLALYRKYRPKTFQEVVGQKAIVTALENQIKHGQIGHAYLFVGTRGTGKTSCAKVFARAVNCLHPQSGNPCNTCEMCLSAETDFNLIEIDAASNSGVDNIRDIRDEAQYTPARGRYKVYIIDEVHNLSKEAFNALLKTLEEPPEHVIFILATTDPQKIPGTIVSRCQRYDFKRIPGELLREHLQRICREEGIEAEEAALSLIANVSDGAVRDALSILDQCHAYHIGGRVTLSEVQDILGAVDHHVFVRLTDALVQKDAAALMEGVQEVFESGRDAMKFIGDWSEYLRNVLVKKVMGDKADKLLTGFEEVREDMKRQSLALSQGQLGRTIEIMAHLYAELRNSMQRRIHIEMTLLSLVAKEED